MTTGQSTRWHAKRFVKASLIAAAIAVLSGVVGILTDIGFPKAIHEDVRQGIGLVIGGVVGFVLSYRVDQLRNTDRVLKTLGLLGLIHHAVLYCHNTMKLVEAPGWNRLPYAFSLVLLTVTAITSAALFLAGLVQIPPRRTAKHTP